MSAYAPKYAEIFDYLSAPESPTEAHPTIVFGRSDPLVAEAAGNLAAGHLAEEIVISGGIGKDSGDILAQGYRSEADFLGQSLHNYALQRGLVLPPVHLEEKAANGAENARFSLQAFKERDIAIDSIISVAHATSSRRLAAGIAFEAQTKFDTQTTIFRVPSKYKFDPNLVRDQDEAAAEMLRIADWPAKGLLLPQPDAPQNLIDFVRDVHGAAPKPIADWQSNLLRVLPSTVRLRLIEFAANHGRK